MFGRFRVCWVEDQNKHRRVCLDAIPPLDKIDAEVHVSRRKSKAEEAERERETLEARLAKLDEQRLALLNVVPLDADALRVVESDLQLVTAKVAHLDEFVAVTEAQIAEIQTRQRDYEGAQGAADEQWHIPQELLDFRKEIDLCDTQLAALALQFPRSINHDLYSGALLGAAIIGLDGTSESIASRQAGAGAPPPAARAASGASAPAENADAAARELEAFKTRFQVAPKLRFLGCVNLALAKSRLDSLRNDLLMHLERPVKQEQLLRVAAAGLLLALLPWLLLLLAGTTVLMMQGTKVGAAPAFSSLDYLLCSVLVLVLAFGYMWGDSQRRPAGQAPSSTPPGSCPAAQPGTVAAGCPPPAAEGLRESRLWAPPVLLAGALLLAAIAITAARSGVQNGPPALANYLLFWTGVMLGVWLSTLRRLQRMQFADLLTPDGDQFRPWVRLVRAGSLSLLLGLILSWGGVIEIFGLRTPEMFSNPGFAFAFGTLFGLADLLLPDAAGAKAEGLFKAVNRTDSA